jgi:replicative DNA helicase
MVTGKNLPLPSDVDAEEALIASLLVDDEAIFKVQPEVGPEDFYRDTNRFVYQACLDLSERDVALNQVTVAHELSRKDQLEDVGGPAFLSQIVLDLPTPIAAKHYAVLVKRDSIYRNLIGMTEQIKGMAYEGGPKIDAVLDRAQDLIMSLRNTDKKGDFEHLRNLLEEYLETPGIDAPSSNVLNQIRTGFEDIDTLLGGLKRSDLVIIAARPSIGKTSLAINIARNAAIGQDARVAVFSLEMAAAQLAQRMLASESGLDSTRLRLGEHTEPEEQKMLGAVGVLAGAEVYIDDSAVLSIAEIRAKAHRLHREQPLDMIIVDYLQLIHGGSGRGDNRVNEVSEISRMLKGLARELDVVVIAASQLSRAPEQRTPHVPMLSDLRESGSIEQDADVVAFIYREDMYVTEEQWQGINHNQPYPKDIAQIIIAKNRNGPTGTVTLRFRKEFTRFENLVTRQEETSYS